MSHHSTKSYFLFKSKRNQIQAGIQLFSKFLMEDSINIKVILPDIVAVIQHA